MLSGAPGEGFTRKHVARYYKGKACDDAAPSGKGEKAVHRPQPQAIRREVRQITCGSVLEVEPETGMVETAQCVIEGRVHVQTRIGLR